MEYQKIGQGCFIIDHYVKFIFKVINIVQVIKLIIQIFIWVYISVTYF